MEWEQVLKQSLNKKDKLNLILDTLYHIRTILCSECKSEILTKEMFHSNRQLCGSYRINGLIENLEKAKQQRGF